MKNFENHFSKKDGERERAKQRVYRAVFKDILDSDSYGFNFETNKKFEKIVNETDISNEEMQVYILERFQKDQGALPGELGKRYANLVYSIDKIKSKLETGLDFHKAIIDISKEVRDKNIILDKDVVNELIDSAKRDLAISEAA